MKEKESELVKKILTSKLDTGEELGKVIVDTANEFQEVIRHRLNNWMVPIVGIHSVIKHQDNAFDEEKHYETLFKALNKFKESSFFNYLILKEMVYENNCFSYSLGKGHLLLLTDKNSSDHYLLRGEDSIEDKKERIGSGKNDIVKKAMHEKNSFNPLCFVTQLGKGNNYFTKNESEVKDEVVAAFFEYSRGVELNNPESDNLDIDLKIMSAIGYSHINEKNELHKFTNRFQDLFKGLRALKYDGIKKLYDEYNSFEQAKPI